MHFGIFESTYHIKPIAGILNKGIRHIRLSLDLKNGKNSISFNPNTSMLDAYGNMGPMTLMPVISGPITLQELKNNNDWTLYSISPPNNYSGPPMYLSIPRHISWGVRLLFNSPPSQIVPLLRKRSIMDYHFLPLAGIKFPKLNLTEIGKLHKATTYFMDFSKCLSLLHDWWKSDDGRRHRELTALLLAQILFNPDGAADNWLPRLVKFLNHNTPNHMCGLEGIFLSLTAVAKELNSRNHNEAIQVIREISGEYLFDITKAKPNFGIHLLGFEEITEGSMKGVSLCTVPDEFRAHLCRDNNLETFLKSNGNLGTNIHKGFETFFKGLGKDNSDNLDMNKIKDMKTAMISCCNMTHNECSSAVISGSHQIRSLTEDFSGDAISLLCMTGVETLTGGLATLPALGCVAVGKTAKPMVKTLLAHVAEEQANDMCIAICGTSAEYGDATVINAKKPIVITGGGGVKESDGTIKLPDGSWQKPDGTIYNASTNKTTLPNGTVVEGEVTEIINMDPEVFTGGDVVEESNGTIKYKDGSWAKEDGTTYDASTDKTHLPDGTVVEGEVTGKNSVKDQNTTVGATAGATDKEGADKAVTKETPNPDANPDTGSRKWDFIIQGTTPIEKEDMISIPNNQDCAKTSTIQIENFIKKIDMLTKPNPEADIQNVDLTKAIIKESQQALIDMVINFGEFNN